MDPLNSPTTPQFLECMRTLKNVTPSQGLRLQDGKLIAISGGTTSAAAQTISHLCETKYREVLSISQQVQRQGVSSHENSRRIVAIRNDLRDLMIGFKNLRASGGEMTALPVLDESYEALEKADQLLQSLEASSLDVLADQLSPEVADSLAIQETTPDLPSVRRRLASPSSTSTKGYIQSASINFEQVCQALRKFASPSSASKVWLWLTTEKGGTLVVQEKGGGWTGPTFYSDLPSISQVVYNACLREVAECEMQVNRTPKVKDKLASAEQSMEKLQELSQAVSQMIVRYSAYLQLPPDSQAFRDKGEESGLATLIDAKKKLQESMDKLHGLLAKKADIEAASLQRRCVMTIDATKTAATDKSKDPEDRFSAINDGLVRLEDLRKYVRDAYVESAKSTRNFEATRACATFQQTMEMLDTYQKEFVALSKLLQNEIRLSDEGAPDMEDDFAVTLAEVEKSGEAGEAEDVEHLPAFETSAYMNEIPEYVSSLKRKLEAATTPEKALEIIAAIPENFLNCPEIADLVRRQHISITELKFGNATILLGQQRLLQRQIDDLMSSIPPGKRATELTNKDVSKAVFLLHDSTHENLLGPSAYASLDNALQYLSRIGSPNLPKISPAQLSITEVKENRTKAAQIEKTFAATFQAVTAIATQLEGTEKERLSVLLDQFHRLSTELDMLGDRAAPQQIEELRTRMNGISLELKKTCDAAQKAIFSKLQIELSRMTGIYNQAVAEKMKLMSLGISANDPRIQVWSELENRMKVGIRECNLRLGNTSLTTNAFTATKGHVMDFAAVVERKMYLRQRALEATAETLPKIRAELTTAPTPEELRKIAAGIQEDLKTGSTQLVSAEEAKKYHKKYPSLKWGEASLNFALCTPANWTTVRTALIKCSRAGRMQVAVSIIEPLGIGLSGGVPAGLRGDRAFITRPANLMKTVSYICLENGEPTAEHVSFRGGQFPTKEAAKTALMHIMVEPVFRNSPHLHINALLTPTALTWFKKDKTLLEDHRENILLALNELIQEAGDQVTRTRLEAMRANLAVSNAGVNEGAVGQTMLPMYLGWHTSIGGFCNPASQKLNQAVHEKLLMLERSLDVVELPPDSMVEQLDLLGPMLQIGQDLESVFALNDYADATVGQNQFKMPALWKAMDALLGVPCYTDCMSGKDRTGKVESCAQEYLDEIAMNVVDHKQELSQEFLNLSLGLTGSEREAWGKAQKILTSACFRNEELKEFQIVLRRDGEGAFKKLLLESLHHKIEMVREGLGMTSGPEGFMVQKEIGGAMAGYIQVATQGISKNHPKIATRGGLQQGFPNLAVSSIYLHPRETDAAYVQYLENRQREAANRRLSQLSGSLEITRINTGKPGFKVEGGEPLAQHSSGFDREFVLYKLRSSNPQNPHLREELTEWTGLHELDPETMEHHLHALHSIISSQMELDQKNAAWTTILQKIEEDKAESLTPKAHVKA